MSDDNLTIIYDSSKDRPEKLNSIERGTMVVVEVDGKKKRTYPYLGLENLDGIYWLRFGNPNSSSNSINLTFMSKSGNIRVYSEEKK